MAESKMEINIINIEDRHQEKAYAIWKAGMTRTARPESKTAILQEPPEPCKFVDSQVWIGL